ncbi:hypothetical protein EI94DRAFT_1747109 [Lactarius quietus]|nr:hypothetical protein EI94DRAFT_1747109 [Lactarius quietus]
MHTPPFVCLSFVIFLFAIRSSTPHTRFALCMSSFGDPLPTYLVLSVSLFFNRLPHSPSFLSCLPPALSHGYSLHPIPIQPTSGIRSFFSHHPPPIIVLSRKPPKKK